MLQTATLALLIAFVFSSCTTSPVAADTTAREDLRAVAFHIPESSPQHARPQSSEQVHACTSSQQLRLTVVPQGTCGHLCILPSTFLPHTPTLPKTRWPRQLLVGRPSALPTQGAAPITVMCPQWVDSTHPTTVQGRRGVSTLTASQIVTLTASRLGIPSPPTGAH